MVKLKKKHNKTIKSMSRASSSKDKMKMSEQQDILDAKLLYGVNVAKDNEKNMEAILDFCKKLSHESDNTAYIRNKCKEIMKPNDKNKKQKENECAFLTTTEPREPTPDQPASRLTAFFDRVKSGFSKLAFSVLLAASVLVGLWTGKQLLGDFVLRKLGFSFFSYTSFGYKTSRLWGFAVELLFSAVLSALAAWF